MKKLLEVKNVSRNFGGLKALKDISFTVNESEVVGLIGPNGAGKTTCFNVVSGVMPPSSGEITFNNKSIVGVKPNEIVRMGLGRTFQATTVFPKATVLENVMRGAYSRTKETFLGSLFSTHASRIAEATLEKRCMEILEQVDIVHVHNHLADGLPYGYQRRLGVAIALASEPEVIMMDEPAAGLNPEESIAMGKLIRDINTRGQASVLIVEHDMRLVMGICDRILVLDHGEQIAAGSPQEIQKNPKVIEAYLGAEVVN